MERRILLVDEATRTRELLASILRMHGFAVFESGDGRDALARVRRIRPDLIIVEAMLPFLSGFEVCATLRRDPVLKNLPILMMCSLARSLVREQHVPADELLLRPFGLHDLLERVDALLARVQEPLGSSR